MPVPPDGRILDPSTLGDHIDRLFRAAWALSGSRADAEDLVQETFALRPREAANGPQRKRHRVSAERAAQHVHQLAPGGGAAPAPETLAEGFEPVDPSSATRPDLAAEAREVFAVIAGLPEPFRDALVAVDVAGLSYGEAADLLGAKEATITSRLFRARAQVARGMESPPEGVQSSRG